MKKILLKPISLAFVVLVMNLLFIAVATGQTTYFSRATGAWDNNTTWSLSSGGAAVGAGVYPIAGDIVNIEGGFTVNIPASASMACATLNITSVNAGNGTLVFNAGSTLAVSGNIMVGAVGSTKVGILTMTAGGTLTCNGNLSLGSDASCNITQGAGSLITVDGTATVMQAANTGTDNSWNVNAGTATVAGLFTLNGVLTSTRDCSIVLTSGTFNANGGIQVDGATAATKNIVMGTNSIMNIGGSGINNAAGALFTSGLGTVNYNAAGNQPNVGNYTYNNLGISGNGTKILLGTTDVNATLSVTQGATLSLTTFSITPLTVVMECGALAGTAITGSGALALGGNLSVNSAGTGTAGATISSPVTLGGARTFTIADDGTAAVDLSISGIIGTSTNSLIKAGDGTMELLAANTYTGLTTINAGTILYGISNALSTGGVTLNGGTLDIGSYSDAVGTVTLTNGSILGTSGVLTSSAAFALQNGTVTAILGGTLGVTKTTAGTVTLSGTNTYTGVTAINGGILSVSSINDGGVPGNIGAATNAASNLTFSAGTLQYTGPTASTDRNFTLSGVLNGIELVTNNLTLNGASALTTGGFTKSGNGTLILDAPNGHTGLTTVAHRTLRYGVNNALSSGGITVNGGILDIGSFSDVVGAVTLMDGEINGTTGTLTGTSYALQDGTISAILAGTGTLTKTTTGTVLLSAVNTFTGVFNINAGTISVATIGDGGVAGNLGAAAATATNLVLGGGTIKYTGATASTNRNFVLSSGTTSTLEITTNTLTISGASTSTSGALTKAGNGTLILSGSNLYTGNTTISAGTIKLGAASERISNSSMLVVEGTFDMNGFNETLGGISGTGLITSSATGNLLLTAGNTVSTDFNGIIQNGSATSISFTKLGSSILGFGGNNTYTGTTTISVGSLLLQAADVIPNNAVTLSGGILNTGNNGGFSETIGVLTVSASSSISLGTGSHTLNIANSSGATWLATATLTINGWTGIGGAAGGGSAGKIIVGTGGLSAAQLAKVVFSGAFGTGAVITGSGELVPTSGASVYYSQGNLPPNVLANWNSNPGGGGFTPTVFNGAGITFVIQNGHTMATTGTWAVTGTGSKIQIENGGILESFNAVSLAASGTFQIDNGGIYRHKNTSAWASTIFAGTEVFGSSSTIEINVTASTMPTNPQYGNLIVNLTTDPSSAFNFSGNLVTIQGDLTISNTQGRECRLTGTASPILNIAGNLIVSGATSFFIMTSGTGTPTINVAGNVDISGGTFSLSGSATSSSASTGTLNVTGNFSHTGGTITEVGSGKGEIVFNGTNQLYTSGGSLANTINFTVNSGTTLQLGTGAVPAIIPNGSIGTFKNFGTLGITDAGGIALTGGTGNVRVSGVRTYDATGNYIYNGTAAQVSGTGLTAANNLEINNAAGVTLSVSAAVSGTLTLTSGNVTTAANTLSVTNSAVGAIVRTSGHIIGNLQRAIATGANTYNYPVGNSGNYLPASLAFTSVGGAGSITVNTKDGAGTNYPASLSATKRMNRNWVITNNGVTGFSVNAGLTFLAGDLGGGVTTGELKAYRAEPGVVYSYPAPADYSISGTTFNYNNITGFSSTAGFTEIGAGGCSASFTATFTKTMASSCGGGSDGTITVTANNATAPVTYSWTSTPAGFTASTAAITGLDSRDYTVVVSDGAGCSVTIPDITIWQAQTPVVTNNGGNSGSCNASGYIILYGSYGIAPFTYSIDGVNYFASNTFNNVAAGTYTGYVKDLRGCVGSKPNIAIGAAAPLGLTYLAKASSSCVNDGSIELYRSGGIGPYTFSLDNITYQSNFKFTNLAAGTYTGWLKDSKGCTVSVANIVVASTAAVTATAGKTNASACLNDGTIQLRGAGGVPGYTYSLDDVTYQSSPSFTGLAAGNYTGWVKDTKGCKGSVLVSITSNTIVVTAYAAGASGCINDGSIQLFRTGGVGPYTYSLDDVTYQSSNTFTGLTGGTYTGWVKDSKGCKASLGGIVITQVPVTATAGFTNTSTCATNGTIQLRPAGGQAPYTFSLDDVTYQGSNTFTGLAAGSYTGWVKDSKGCKGSVNVNVGTTTLSVTAFPTDASSCVATDGSILLGRNGGFGPYTYSLDGTNYQAGNVFSGLAPGTYDGYIKDSKNCVGVTNGVIVGPNCGPLPPITKHSIPAAKSAGKGTFQVQAYPNPSTSGFNLTMEGNGAGKVSVIITDMSGRIIRQATLSARQLYKFGNDLKPGVYFVQVTQGNEMQTIRVIKQ